MTEHTPGPWEANGNVVSVVGRNGLEICHTEVHRPRGEFKPYDECFEVAEANAHLIARAPDLLVENEALKARISELEAQAAHNRGLLWFSWREFNAMSVLAMTDTPEMAAHRRFCDLRHEYFYTYPQNCQTPCPMCKWLYAGEQARQEAKADE